MIKIRDDWFEIINLTNISKNAVTKPDWLRVKAPQVERIGNTANLLSDLKLNTVCQEASCPNTVSYTHLTLPTICSV